MIALASSSLFVLAALAAVFGIAGSWRRYGNSYRALRAQLAACPESTPIHWKSIERTALAEPVVLSARRAERRQPQPARELNWPLAA